MSQDAGAQRIVAQDGDIFAIFFACKRYSKVKY